MSAAHSGSWPLCAALSRCSSGGVCMKMNLNLAAVLALGLGGVGAAQAAVPASAEAVFTGLTTDFGTIAGYGYVAMGVITGGLIVFGLIQRVARKSAK